MTKLYFRVMWFMHFYQRAHPLVTPGVWVCALVMGVAWLYNVADFIFGFHKG